MTETPLPARVAALRLTTPPSYNLRNREIPRDDPAGSETPTLNLRSRSVVRDSPAPLKTGGEHRDAFREFEKHFETAKEFSRKAVRRTVRWWNGSGWAMRAAVACWGIALLLWLVNSSDSSTNAGPATVIPPANVPPVVVTAPVKQQEPVVEPKPVAKPIPEPAKPVEVVAPQPASLGSAFGPANRTSEASTQTTDDTPDPEPLPIPEPEPEPPRIAEFTSLFKVDGKGTSDTFALLPSGPASYWFAKMVDWMFGWRMVLAEGQGPQVVLQGGKGCWPVKGAFPSFVWFPEYPGLSTNGLLSLQCPGN